MRAWLIATRPHTLPAGASPVIVGAGLGLHQGLFEPLAALAALVGALLIQIGANLANDYYDAVKGVDSEQTEGYTRVTEAGLIEPGRVQAAMWATFGLAILVGIYLVYVGGIPILAVGLLGIASGIAYAGGPYPLGSHGLGDLFVFIWFGVIAVTGTYYVQAAAHAGGAGFLFPDATSPELVPLVAVVASLPAAALTTNILVVNNVRDLEADRKAGKYTLAVLIGSRWSRVEYLAMLGLAYFAPVALWFGWESFSPAVLLPLGTIPFAAGIARTVTTENGEKALNPALERTGQLLAAHSVLFAVGLVLSAGVV